MIERESIRGSFKDSIWAVCNMALNAWYSGESPLGLRTNEYAVMLYNLQILKITIWMHWIL